MLDSSTNNIEMDDDNENNTNNENKTNNKKNVDNYEEERELMRVELSSYLDSLKTITGSDGKSLISIPTNFDVVSDAMTKGIYT